jgi:hypothetical protein
VTQRRRCRQLKSSLEFDQTDAGSVALRGASKAGYAEVYSRSSFSDQLPLPTRQGRCPVFKV